MPEAPNRRAPIVGATTQVSPTLFLEAANGAIRRECGWHVAPSVTETLTLDGKGGRLLLLPTGHVTAVSSVVVGGVDLTASADWSTSGMLELRAGAFPRRFRAVQVTLTHGYDPEEVPEVVALIVKLAQRAKDSTTIAAQATAGSSVSYVTAGGAPLSIPLLQGEKDILTPYRLGHGA
ncbi:hypothetical protein [Rathayibacter sp. VKM Ac-2630]|uniref:hypothetical protein n=1 Tax=Rathayibacter sp. VKM Ac-2630 TaxID=1938617 RepID=UPI000980F9D0|nr:hypothetical protein [Rathayibacter sp. VKM Ac-2630]OOB90743.1 hypothetical protein B0T42_10065 [Rathayibacter sp. VKM Ac-2630]